MTHHLRLSHHVTQSCDEAGCLVLARRGEHLRFRQRRDGLATFIRELAGGAEEGALVRGAGSEDRKLLLGMLETGGWIDRSLLVGGATVATLEPQGVAVTPEGEPTTRRFSPKLSRFASIRTLDGELVIETPRSGARVRLRTKEAVLLVAQLETGPAQQGLGLPKDAAVALVGLLARAGVLADTAEREELRMVQWSATDLAFHHHSRRGRHSDPYGGTFHLWDRSAPPPALKPAVSLEVILERPDLRRLRQSDPPFQSVVEQRRSRRDYDETSPITKAQLSEFLFRTVADRDGGATDPPARPYPAGGGMRGLEVYTLIRQCKDIQNGLYYYDPIRHGLALITRGNAGLQELLHGAKNTVGMDTPPQVLLLLTCRVGRLMRKYESIAYSVILKDVGVIYAHFYLAATAMGLGACALGGGDSEAFARHTGIDPYDEPRVGEFIVGAAPRASA